MQPTNRRNFFRGLAAVIAGTPVAAGAASKLLEAPSNIPQTGEGQIGELRVPHHPNCRCQIQSERPHEWSYTFSFDVWGAAKLRPLEFKHSGAIVRIHAGGFEAREIYRVWLIRADGAVQWAEPGLIYHPGDKLGCELYQSDIWVKNPIRAASGKQQIAGWMWEKAKPGSHRGFVGRGPFVVRVDVAPFRAYQLGEPEAHETVEGVSFGPHAYTSSALSERLDRVEARLDLLDRQRFDTTPEIAEARIDQLTEFVLTSL